jgi:hypothetical protein
MKALPYPLLFAATALATGWQVYRLLMSAFWNRPSLSQHYATLLGAAVLLVGAVVAYRHARTGSAWALAGCLLLWAYYAAIWFTFLSAGPGPVTPLFFLPPALLVLSTWLAVLGVVLDPEPDEPARGVRRDHDGGGSP